MIGGNETGTTPTTYLPKASKREVGIWSSTPPPWERKTDILYRESDVRSILELLNNPARKSVLIEGKGGVGKSTTIIELASVLEKQGQEYALLNPKVSRIGPDSLSDANIAMERAIRQLEEFTQLKKDSAFVLIDAGDYLFAPIYGTNKNFIDLLTSPKETLTKEEAEILNHYRNSNRLMNVLKSPQFKTVTTWHPDWPIENREPTLYPLWKSVFPDESKYVLSPRVPLMSGVAYLKDRSDLPIAYDDHFFLEVLAGALQFGELKNLKPSEFLELKGKLSSLGPRDTLRGIITINAWADNHSSVRTRERASLH